MRATEFTHSRKRADRNAAFALRPITTCVLAALAQCAAANPTGPQVAAGSASVSASGKTLTVTNTPGTILNWQSFSIAPGELTKFVQQSSASAVLNRVVAANPSSILGTLQSNGRVFLVNPHGIVIGAGALIDTAGFVASTLNIADKDFLAGKLRFEGGGAGVLRNEGTIQAARDIFLVGPQIENTGIIRSAAGDVVLAAGKSVTITSPDANGVQFGIQAPEDSVVNLGAIQAANAVGLFAGTLKHSGEIKVTSASLDSAGRVVLSAQKDTIVDGNATIAVDNSVGRGGKVAVLGERVGLFDNATITATGAAGGGEILVGGDYRGLNPDVRNAFITYFAPNARLDASSSANGAGGRVIVWADDTTRAHGYIGVRGGPDGGNGGFVETSGKRYLEATRGPDIGAPKGKPGEWLLDPGDIDVNNTCTVSCLTPTGPAGNRTFSPGASDSAELRFDTTLQPLVEAGGIVTIDTSGGGSANPGNITFAVPAAFTLNTAAATLNLKANGTIDLSPGISKAGGQALTINFIPRQLGGATTADAAVGTGIVSNGNLTLGGTFSIVSGRTPITVQNFAIPAGANVAFNTGGSSINVGTGRIDIDGTATLTAGAGGTNSIGGNTGSLISINNGGIFNLGIDAGFSIPAGGTPQLNILAGGQLIKNAGAGGGASSDIAWAMNNAGTVSVTSGLLKIIPGTGSSITTGTLNSGAGATLDLSAGVSTGRDHQLGDGAQLTGTGAWAYTGLTGTLQLTGTAAGAGAKIVNGASLQFAKSIGGPGTGKLTNQGLLFLNAGITIAGDLVNDSIQAGNTLFVAGPGTVQVNSFTLTRGQVGIAGGATLSTNGGAFNWSGGTIPSPGGGRATINAGNFNVSAGLTNPLTIDTRLDIAATGTTTINGGATLVITGDGSLTSGTTTIASNGTLTINSNNSGYNNPGAFNNSGTFNLDAAGRTQTFGNGGTGTGGKFNVVNGSAITFANGAFTMNGGQLNGTGGPPGGSYLINAAATVTLDGVTSSNIGTFTHSGTLIVNNTNTLSGTFNWQPGGAINSDAGGTLNLSGSLSAPNVAGANRTMNFATGAGVTGPTVNVAANDGTNIATNIAGATLQVTKGAVNLNNDSSIDTTIDVGANQTFTFAAGAHSLGSGSNLTGAGNFVINGSANATVGDAGWSGTGTLSIAGGGKLNVTNMFIDQTVNQSGGTFSTVTGTTHTTNGYNLSGSGILSLGAGTTLATDGTNFTWSGGTLTGTGALSLSAAAGPAGTFSITGNGVRVLDGPAIGTGAVTLAVPTPLGPNSLEILSGTLTTTAFTNNATLKVTGGTLNTGLVTNNATLQQTAGIFAPDGLDNAGTFTYSAINGFNPGAAVNNTGTLAVTAGTLSLPTNGTHTNGIFNVAGTLNFTGGTHTFDGTGQLNGAGTYGVVGAATNLILNGATFNATGPVNNAGIFTLQGSNAILQNGGTQSGSFNVAAGRTLTFGGTGTHTLNGGTALNGPGDVVIDGATITLGAGPAITRGNPAGPGVDAGLINFAAGTINGNGTLAMQNNALFRTTTAANKTIAGTNTFSLLGLHTQSGTLILQSSALNATNATLDAGSTLQLDGGTFAPTGTVNNDAIINLNAGGNSFTLPGGGYHKGTFNVASTKQISFTSGTHTLDGAILMGAGGFVFSTADMRTDMHAVTVNAATSLSLTGGTLTLGANLDRSGGTFTWSGASTIAGTATLSNAALSLTGATTKTLNGATIDATTINHTFSPSTLTLQSGALNASGTVLIGNGAILQVAGGTFAPSALLNNGGTITVNTGNTVNLPGTGAHAGTFNVADGATLNFTNGNHTFNGATFNVTGTGAANFTGGTQNLNSGTNQFLGTGTVSVNGGALTTSVDTTAAVSTFNFDAGTFNIAATKTFTKDTGTFGWAAGTFGGTGTLALTNGATFSFVGNNARTLGSAGTGPILNLAATTLPSGSLTLAGGTLSTTGLFTNQATVTVSGGAFNPNTLNNAGTLNLMSGTFTPTSTVNNTGTLAVSNNSTFSLPTGGTHTNGIFNVAIGSTLNFSGGTHTFDGASPTNRLQGGGTYAVVNAPTQVVFAAPTVSVSGTFNNGGTVAVNSGAVSFAGGGTHGSTFIVDNGATLSLSGAQTYNNSTFTVDGTLNFGTGAQTLNGGTFSGAGTVNNAGATLSIAGNVTDGVLFNQNSGTLTLGAGNTLTQNRDFTWTGGTLGGTGTLAMGAGTTFTMSGGNAKTLNGPVLNLGATTLAAGASSSLSIDGGTLSTSGTFTNNATITVNGGIFSPTSLNNTASGTVTLASGTLSPTGMDNAGTFIYTGGNFTPQGGAAVNNAGGTVRVDAGTLSLSTNGTHTGTFNVTGGLQFTNNSTHTFSSAATLTGAGTYDIVGANTTLTFNSPTFNATGGFSNGGILNINGGTINLAGGGTDSGTFNIANGQTLGFTGVLTHTLNAGTTFNGNTSGTVVNSAPLSIAGNVTSGALFSQNGGSLTLGAGTTFTQNKNFTWSGGAIAGPGILAMGAGATFDMSGTNARTLNGPTLNLGATTLGAGASNTLTIQSGTLSTSGLFTNNATVTLAGGIFSPTGMTNSSTGVFNYNGGTFTPQGAAAVNNAGIVNINNTTTPLTLTTNGTHSGTFTVASNARLDISGGTHTFNGATINGPGEMWIFGTANVTLNNPTFGLTGPFDNDAILTVGAGTLNLGVGSITHNGTFNVSDGAALNFTGGTVDFTNATLNPSGSGTIAFTGGIYNVSGTTQFNGTGIVNNNATLNINADTSAAVNLFQQSAGTLNIAGSRTFTKSTGVFDFRGGQVNGPGTLSMTNSATFSASNSGNKTLNNLVVNALNLHAVSGALILQDTSLTAGGTLTVNPGAAMQVNGTSVFTANGGGQNDGTITLNANTLSGNTFTLNNSPFVNANSFVVNAGSLLANSAFNDTGTFTVTNGSARFSGGGVHTNGIFDVAANGSLFFSGGINTLNNTQLNGPGTYQLSGGTLRLPTNTSSTRSGGPLRWAGASTIDGGGTLNIAADALFNPQGSGVRMLNGATIVDAGPTIIAAGATFQIDSGTFTPTGPVTNLGLFRVNAGTVNLSAGGSQQGTVDVASGATVNFTGGTHTLTGAQFIGPGTVIQSGGTINVSSSSTSSNALFQLTNGQFIVSNGQTFTKNGGTFAFQGGIIGGPGGTLTGINSATVTYPGSGVRVFNGPTANIDNITLGAGSLTVQSGTVNVSGPTSVGTGTALALQGGTLNTQGSFNVSGTLANNAVINNANPINIQSGGVVAGSGSFFGNIVNVAGTLSPGNSPGTMVIHGNYTQMANGVLVIDIEGNQQGVTYDFIDITGTANLAGTLQIRNGGAFVPTASDRFTFMRYASRTGDFTNFVYPVGFVYTPRPGTTDYAVTPGRDETNQSTMANNTATQDVIVLKEEQKTSSDVTQETREEDKNKVKGAVCS